MRALYVGKLLRKADLEDLKGRAVVNVAIKGGTRTETAVSNLLLDPDNPRFGTGVTTDNQTELLDHIVDNFGVLDILSSLAVNGFFEAEPLVCVAGDSDRMFVVLEGNRRLAACIILADDPRAKNQRTKVEKYQKIWNDHGSKIVEPVPLLLFDRAEHGAELLPYLGVRHIASSQPWDSFAKAAWVAKTVRETTLSVEEITQMVGDNHQTVNRLLEGFYLVDQMTETGHFPRENSVKRGRGSFPYYPFSWVYTMLGYRAVRDYLKLADGEVGPNPVATENLERAGNLFRAMFGDGSKGRSASISDSRELGDLARAFGNTETASMIISGESVSTALDILIPISERLIKRLAAIRKELRELNSELAENSVEVEVAEEIFPAAQGVRSQAIELAKKITAIKDFAEDDE